MIIDIDMYLYTCKYLCMLTFTLNPMYTFIQWPYSNFFLFCISVLQNVDANVLDMQPYYGPILAPVDHHQFVSGVNNEYVPNNNNGCIPISQCQPSPISQYVVPSPSLSEGVVMVQENNGGSGFISNGYTYYPPVGTLMPVYMSSPVIDGPLPLSCDPYVFPHPVVIPCSSPSILRASAPDWIQQAPKFKGSLKGEVLSIQPNNNHGHSDHHHPLKAKSILKPSFFTDSKEPEPEDARKTETTPVSQMVVPSKESNTSHLGSYEQNGTLVHAGRNMDVDAWVQPCQLDNAKYFIIKSFNEANIYRSIQHGVWSSTPNGNKKLDQAFKDAKCQAEANGFGCPIFLFFSVCISTSFIL